MSLQGRASERNREYYNLIDGLGCYNKTVYLRIDEAFLFECSREDIMETHFNVNTEKNTHNHS